VTRSTGIGAGFVGSARRSASARAFTASVRPRWSGPRFEPDDAAALYANGAVAERRPQKYRGSSKGWPMSAEPTAVPFRRMRLPRACTGKTVSAIPVTRSG
jgi:hypothetical protein